MTERQVVMHDEAESVHFRILVAILLLCPQLQKQRFFRHDVKIQTPRIFSEKKARRKAKFLLFSYNVRREAEHAARAGLARLLIRTIMFFSQVPGPVLPPLRREAHA